MLSSDLSILPYSPQLESSWTVDWDLELELELEL